MMTVSSKEDSPSDNKESAQAFMAHGASNAPPAPTSTQSANATDHYIDNQGDVVCFDPAINRDPALMAQFIRKQAQIPPKLIVHIKGSHEKTEWERHTATSSYSDNGRRVSDTVIVTNNTREATRTVSRDHLHHDGHSSHYESSSQIQITRTVTDFDFKIDISHNIAPEPEYFVIADNVAAYRGQTFMELDLNPGGRHRANNAMQARAKTLEEGEKERIRHGGLPWQTRNAGGSLTLEEWCADYIGSGGQIKDFKFTKVIHGWDLNSLEATILDSITAELYSGEVEISFETPSGNGIHVRPSTGFSKARSNMFLRGLLNVSLVWPITHYLYEQQWRTCGATYALKQWVHLADSLPGDDVGSYAARVGRPIDPNRLTCTPQGISEIRGVRESEWFARWKSTIKNAVNENIRDEEPLVDPHHEPSIVAARVDGGYLSSASQRMDSVNSSSSSLVIVEI